MGGSASPTMVSDSTGNKSNFINIQLLLTKEVDYFKIVLLGNWKMVITMVHFLCFTSVSPDVCLVAVVIFVLLPTYCTYVGTCMAKNINQWQIKYSTSCQSSECSPMHESVLFVGGGVPRTNIPSV